MAKKKSEKIDPRRDVGLRPGLRRPWGGPYSPFDERLQEFMRDHGMIGFDEITAIVEIGYNTLQKWRKGESPRLSFAFNFVASVNKWKATHPEPRGPYTISDFWKPSDFQGDVEADAKRKAELKAALLSNDAEGEKTKVPRKPRITF